MYTLTPFSPWVTNRFARVLLHQMIYLAFISLPDQTHLMFIGSDITDPVNQVSVQRPGRRRIPQDRLTRIRTHAYRICNRILRDLILQNNKIRFQNLLPVPFHIIYIYISIGAFYDHDSIGLRRRQL